MGRPLPSAAQYQRRGADKLPARCNVITGYENNLPVYNEYHLCFDPKERLYIHHYWQEGLVPREGVPHNDRQELERFHGLMEEYKHKRGADGREAFAIPAELSSQDPELLMLDAISMDAFLTQRGFNSPYLRWYVQYCCADDYGSSLTDTSPEAVRITLASRKGRAANASPDTVLTWPEGNGWLTRQLQQPVAHAINCQCLVYAIKPTATGVTMDSVSRRCPQPTPCSWKPGRLYWQRHSSLTSVCSPAFRET